jgi:hypothetical protein
LKRQTPIQTQKETMPPQMRGLLSHAAVRTTPDRDMPSNGSIETRFGHDFSQVSVRPSVQTLGQDYSNASCPMFPQRSPFGGACHICPPRVQAKLKTGQPGDKYEQEADRVADQLMRMPEPGHQLKPNQPFSRGASCRVEGDIIQKYGEISESKNIVDHELHNTLQISTSQGKPLASDVRFPFEQSFGHSFKDVRIISNRNAACIADQLDARALTVGQYIWFGQGEFRPDTVEGRRLLAHELVHAVQQSSGSGALQKDMLIGRSFDSAELEADKVADAVLRGEPSPKIQQHSSVLRREARPSCMVSSASSPDQRNVQCGDQRYRVTISIVNSREPETQTSVDFGWNDTSILLDIEICRGGTAVNIRPSVNLREALINIIGNLLGRSDALQGVTITPELRIIIVQSRRYSISLSGGPIVDLGSREVTGGRGGISADTPIGRLGLGVEGRRGGQVMVTVRVTPGDFRPETRDCSRRRRRLRMRCERITVIPAVHPTPERTETLRREVYLLFPYAKSSPIERVLIREGSGRPRTSSISEVSAIGTQGYRVQSIEGFASPEGPRLPSRRRRFIGNEQLSQNRANEAQSWLVTNCPDCEEMSVTPAGRSELFSPGQTPEVEGRPLTQYATEEFLASNDPLRQGTEQELRTLEQAPLQTQRDSIYPLLRRAVIVLERSVVVQPARPESPRRVVPSNVTCPREVREAIRNYFGISII